MVYSQSGSTANFWLCATLACLAVFVASADAVHMPDPIVSTDPKADVINPLVKNTLSAVAISLVVFVASVQTGLFWKYGGRCMLSMVIGEFTWAVGFGTRFGLHVDPDSSGKYIAYYLFIVLSPCAFIASEYMLMGRLARHLNFDKHLWISPRRITTGFIASDISTFLIQLVGASISTSNLRNQSVSKIGQQIFLAGLALQLVSFFLFTSVSLRFLYRVKTLEHDAWAQDSEKPWHQDWRTLSYVLILSSICILIRCVFRAIELSQGYHSHLTTNEVYFYTLDSLPLFLAVAVYTPFWPGRMILAIDKLAMVDKVDSTPD